MAVLWWQWQSSLPRVNDIFFALLLSFSITACHGQMLFIAAICYCKALFLSVLFQKMCHSFSFTSPFAPYNWINKVFHFGFSQTDSLSSKRMGSIEGLVNSALVFWSVSQSSFHNTLSSFPPHAFSFKFDFCIAFMGFRPLSKVYQLLKCVVFLCFYFHSWKWLINSKAVSHSNIVGVI